jgi:hypothetical protein
LYIARDRVKRSSDIPKGSVLGFLGVVCSFDFVEYREECHVRALIQSVSVLFGVENIIFVPGEVDALANDGGPCFARDLIQADRSHIFQFRIAGNLWC